MEFKMFYKTQRKLLVKIQPIFYSDPIDSVFKSLGAV